MDLLKKFGPLLQQVAPTLATALGGPLAGLAVKTISDAVLGKPDGTSDQIAEALSVATPDTLAKLKQIDADFKVEMKRLDIDLAQIDMADRDSARRREVETKDMTPKVLAATVIIGFFTVLSLLAVHGTPTRGADAVMIMVGALGAAFTAIIGYYYGSSAGSAEKNDLIKRMRGL